MWDLTTVLTNVRLQECRKLQVRVLECSVAPTDGIFLRQRRLLELMIGISCKSFNKTVLRGLT